MKAKKISTMILIATSVISLLAGCGSNTEGSQSDSTKEEAKSKKQDVTDTEDTSDSTGTESTASEGGKTLVVYYSATGNTENVANAIAQTTGGTVFGLEPAEPYSDEDLDWTDSDSRVSREHENEDERDIELVSVSVDNWESYDTVFIGYPIWWGIAAWPVDEFVETNDFTGKTVIPFATSSTSGMGESGELLAELAGTGDWKEGQRFRSGAEKEEMQEWVQELGIDQ